LRAPTPSAAAEIVVRTRQEFEKHVAELQRCVEQRLKYLLLEWRHRVRDLETHRAFRQLEQLVRRRRQLVDERAGALTEALRARMKNAHRRLTLCSARVASFDLRGRADAFRLRLSRQEAELSAALGRFVNRKRRRFSAAQMGVAAFDLRARIERLRRRYEKAADELRVNVDRLIVAKKRRLDTANLRREERSPFQLLERGYAIVRDAKGRVLRSSDQVAVGEDISVRLARGEVGATVKTKKRPAQ
jgi:exodeoxyribonuclease VII large subunit